MNPKPFQINRRRFLKTSAALSAATGVPGWFLEQDLAQAATPKPLSANDKPGVALVGCGGQGRGDCNGARRFGEVIAVCDVDKSQAAAAAKQFTAGEKVPVIYNDFRKLMERDDVHIIITGTPDHWHTMVNLLAVKTGKDVYSEKPLTLCIDEGKRLVKAVRENQRILQVGSQQRSDRNFRLACELVRNGRIGKLQHMIVGLPTGPNDGPFQTIPIPESLNWDFYLGQAPKMDYVGDVEIKKGADGAETKSYKARCAHWDFRWWYCFSGGQMTDWGAHHDDIAQWGNGTERSGPVEIDGKALSAMKPGGFTAAATYRIDMKYANGVTLAIVDENTGTDRNVVGDRNKTPNGIQFIGSGGWIFVTRGAIKASQQDLLDTPLAEDRTVKLYKSSDHMGNFFECVRNRKAPICDVEIGHRSISVAHLGVISIRMNQPLKWNPDQEVFTGANAAEANRWLVREQRKPYDYSFIA
ncbi:MAG: Gfo/Idh/MocA family oxidoreductase [Verrucomicrobiota bacterium]